MKTKTKTKLGNLALPTTLSLLTLASIASIYINSSPAHAESTSASANASVTVSDTIRLTLTGGDLVINNLTPGTSADSNIITATVTSNSPYGFHLSATTGTKNGTTSLVNTADSNFSFTSLDSNKASLSNFSDNTWGYSYSTNDGTSWVSGDYGTTQTGYNGLSLDNDDSGATGTTLFNSDTYTNSTAVKFKIGAKSSSTQASGTYTGTVNFYAVTNPGPKTIADATTMQEVEACPESIPMETVYTLTDPRDNQTYKVARLKDGKCWMVENLNLAGGTALSADNTGVTSEYIANYTAGDSRLAKSGDTLILPTSATAGFNTNNYSYVYNSGNKSTTCTSPGCYSYYSWDAATLGSGRTLNTENTDAPYSICPKGWRLPTSGSDSSNGWKRGDFYQLATAYGANLESNYYENSSTFYNNAGPGTIPNFLLAGYYYDGSFLGGSYGFYWSSTPFSYTSLAHNLDFDSSYVHLVNIRDRYVGFSVRCLLNN